jgi:hypothetical protein
MNRLLLCGLAVSAVLATTSGAAGSGQSGKYHLQNAWPSKTTAQKQRGLKAKTAPRRKKSTEKGGTVDVNIGVGELQARPGRSPRVGRTPPTKRASARMGDALIVQACARAG